MIVVSIDFAIPYSARGVRNRERQVIETFQDGAADSGFTRPRRPGEYQNTSAFRAANFLYYPLGIIHKAIIRINRGSVNRTMLPKTAEWSCDTIDHRVGRRFNAGSVL